MSDNPKPDGDALRLLAKTVLESNKFDWSEYYGDGFTEHDCGTHGCVLGHCPAVFPDRFRFDTTEDILGGIIAVDTEPYDEGGFPQDEMAFALKMGLTIDEAFAISIGEPIADLPNIDVFSDGPGHNVQLAHDRILAVLAIAEARYANGTKGTTDE